MTNTLEIYDEGIDCLVKNLGVIKTEEFISLIKRDNFDYTKWHTQYFDKYAPGEIKALACEYEKEHPFQGSGKII